MFFAGFVVAEEFALENVFEKFSRDDARSIFLGTRAFDSELERVVRGAGVSVGKRGDAKEGVVGDFEGFVA